MEKPLVTILTPVYNGEKYIQRFIDSVLNQTYSNIYFILVNDGSSDRTDEIIMKNKKKIEEKYAFKYIKQKNSGQAGAINTGLKYLEGDYLTWPDSDDLLTVDSIEKKVEFLEKNKDYGFVRTNYIAVYESNLDKKLYEVKPRNLSTNIFDDLILEKTYCTNGAYMVRVKDFVSVVPEKKIYESKGGQNWQMLLPIAYSFKCGYLNFGSYIYVIRKDSHSRQSDGDFEREIKRNKELIDILTNTVGKIPIDNRNKYSKMINNKSIRGEMIIGIKHKKRDFAKERYKRLKKKNELKINDRIYYILGKNRFTDYLSELIDK